MTGFDLRRAALLARFSDLAYRTPDVIDRVLSTHDHELLAFLDEGGTQAFVAAGRDDTLAIVFRGTQKDRRDILTDIDARFYRAADGRTRIHNGFYRAYRWVHRQIAECVGDTRFRGVHVAGHSLGGALAQTAAFRLPGDRLLGCYSYGSPRVGDADLGADLGCPHYRLVHGPDIVPWLPFWSMGYRHTGDLYYIATDGRLIENAPWWRPALAFVTALPGQRLKAHRSAANYVLKLELCARRRWQRPAGIIHLNRAAAADHPDDGR